MPTVAYVVARGRTGSTLLGNLLAQAPGVVHPGELITLWQVGLREQGRVCGCGERVLACPFWKEVARRTLGENWTAADVERMARLRRAAVRIRRIPAHFLRPQLQGIEDTYARAVSGLYAHLAEVGEADVIVDSSKAASMAAFLPGVPGIRPAFINIVRDPRAVAYSLSRMKALPDGTLDARAGALAHTLPTHVVARQWLQRQLFAEALHLRYPRIPWLRIRYEDLATDPQAAMDRMTDLLERPRVALAMDGDTLDLQPTHTAGGNPSRIRSGPTTVRPDERWRDELSHRDERLVTAITAPLLGRYGYPLRPRTR